MFITTTAKARLLARFAQKLPRARSLNQHLAPGVGSSNSWRPCSPRALLTLGSPLSTHAVLRLHAVRRRIHGGARRIHGGARRIHGAGARRIHGAGA